MKVKVRISSEDKEGIQEVLHLLGGSVVKVKKCNNGKFYKAYVDIELRQKCSIKNN